MLASGTGHFPISPTHGQSAKKNACRNPVQTFTKKQRQASYKPLWSSSVFHLGTSRALFSLTLESGSSTTIRETESQTVSMSGRSSGNSWSNPGCLFPGWLPCSGRVIQFRSSNYDSHKKIRNGSCLPTKSLFQVPYPKEVIIRSVSTKRWPRNIFRHRL